MIILLLLAWSVLTVAGLYLLTNKRFTETQP